MRILLLTCASVRHGRAHATLHVAAAANSSHACGRGLPLPCSQVGIIQPGTGIELVLNEATKRKSSSAAGFNSQVSRRPPPSRTCLGPCDITRTHTQTDTRVWFVLSLTRAACAACCRWRALASLFFFCLCCCTRDQRSKTQAKVFGGSQAQHFTARPITNHASGGGTAAV